MRNAELAVRELVETWHRATAAGDVPQILRLMAEDVVFLVPGQPPMRGKDGFAKGLQALLEHHRITSTSKIEEIKVFGDWAYCWSHLSVTVTPLEAGSPKRRTGNALSILRREPEGTWVVVRDANMLAASEEDHS